MLDAERILWAEHSRAEQSDGEAVGRAEEPVA